MENIGAVKRSSTSMKSISRKDSKGVSFREKLDGVTSRNPKENIEKLFNLRVEARAVGKDDKSVFSNVRAGLAPVVIAPNILKKMETDKDLEQRIIKSIDRQIKSIPYGKEFLRARGRELLASGTIVHEDGTITRWTMSDYTPEEKERLRRAQEEEQEQKDKLREKLEDTRIHIYEGTASMDEILEKMKSGGYLW